MLYFVIYLFVIAFVLSCILSQKFRHLVAKLILGSLAVALLIYGGFALQDAARAEDVDSEFYSIVGIITNFEENECYIHDKLVTDYLVEVDDSDNIWAYHELSSEVEFDSDKDMNDAALRFIVDNCILAETLRDFPLTEGRIVFIRMWTCGTEEVEDDEIVGVYYTEFIAAQ